MQLHSRLILRRNCRFVLVPRQQYHPQRRYRPIPVIELSPDMANSNGSEAGAAVSADTRALLRTQFLDQPATKHPERWDDLWQRNLTPWDRSGPSEALRDAITLKHAAAFGQPSATQEKRKRALVPGCGRGYDVLLLAALGYDAYGLDASATAIAAAEQYRAASGDDPLYAAQNPAVGRGQAKFLYGDFFDDSWLAETSGGAFDVIFDYTFLCALPPELRPRWAARLSGLLATEGRLVCLEWPLGKPPSEGGPPHGLTSDLYIELFRRPGEEVRYDDAGKVVAGESSASATALVREAHYQPERTHAAGKDKDFVSIWKHV